MEVVVVGSRCKVGGNDAPYGGVNNPNDDDLDEFVNISSDPWSVISDDGIINNIIDHGNKVDYGWPTVSEVMMSHRSAKGDAVTTGKWIFSTHY